MSTKRKATPQENHEARLEAKSKGLCRYCGLDVKRLSTRRSTFCSNECVEEFLVRNDPGYARKAVYKRDKGVCQICGLNCSKWFSDFKKFIYEIPYMRREEAAKDYFQDHGIQYVPDWVNRRTFWDCDHIQEVVNGGGQCGLENLQLICVPCHRAKTVHLNKTRPRKGKAKGIMVPETENANQ